MKLLTLARNTALALAFVAATQSASASPITCYDAEEYGTICTWCQGEQCTVAFCPDGTFVWC
jgi:hypothetical protein